MENLKLYISLALGLIAIVIIYKALMSPELRYHSFFYKLKAKLFFWLGDIRRLHGFPYITWAAIDHKIDYKDVRHTFKCYRPGDIGLHKDEGFLSNLAIPGGFKHAWVHVDNDEIIEAVSDGVLKRDSIYPLASDYAMILRPMDVTQEEIAIAVERAKSLEGCEYDANFKFDFEETNEEFKKYTANLKSGSFHSAFSCTETAAFSWYHCKRRLEIFRTTHAGREAIVGDDFLKMHFEIVWMSPTITMQWAEKVGMHEEGRHKIKDYLDGKRKFDDFGNPSIK